MAIDVDPAALDAAMARYGPLVAVGAGAWSRAFRGRYRGSDVVVRLGPHVADFLADADAAQHDGPGLPIPQVLEVRQIDPPNAHLHACVSAFVPGRPLESVEVEAWRELVPSVVDVFDAMRRVMPPTDVPSWPERLVADDRVAERIEGARERLAAAPELSDAHQAVLRRLGSLAAAPSVAAVTPTLVHGDLINRNVHVAGGRITGVFDWGSRQWGDHLLDLAWIAFWAPWHPNLDVDALTDHAARRWGAQPDPTRLAACWALIGADHIAYYAAIDDEAAGRAVCERLGSLGVL